MDDDFFRGEMEPVARGHDNLFAWTVFILLLIGFALASWLGSFYIFGHPENPRSYAILKKLHKVDPPKRFELTAAPPGEFLTPQKLYDRYILFSRHELEHENQELLRNYITNYQENKKLVPYVIGRFSILDSFELKKNNMFFPGVVALAQSAESPQVLVEHIYTAASADVPVLQRMLLPGLDMKFERSLDLSAIIHVEKISDGRLQFTAVPLLYGSYALKQASGSFSLQPPDELDLAAGVPVIKNDLLKQALEAGADFRKTKLLAANQAAPSASATPASREIVRADPLPIAVPLRTPKPAALAKVSPSPTPAQTQKSTPAPTVIAALQTPIPTPPAVRVATPMPMTPQGVPLQPFLAAAATPIPAAANGGSWRTFRPGQIPRGRVVDPTEASDLAARGVGSERLYLRGDFKVTAAGDNRAILRVGGEDTTRIIAEFPAGVTPPGEGSTVSRDDARPFQITDIRRGADGHVNVYVREITTP
ncbi:MAG: hypothetical protein M3O82_02685 [Verrucomicrobiota bacterium]|nr:hypothetical protein [Verrucomicrobiota bacterium]